MFTQLEINSGEFLKYLSSLCNMYLSRIYQIRSINKIRTTPGVVLTVHVDVTVNSLILYLINSFILIAKSFSLMLFFKLLFIILCIKRL